MTDQIFQEATHSLFVPMTAAVAYEEKKELLLEEVNRELSKNPLIHGLIGRNSLEVMYDNHRHHVQFMVNIFKLNAFELLAETVPWVYRAYSARGFSFDYFPIEIRSWMRAVEEHLPATSSQPVNSVYRWLLQKHEEMIALSCTDQELFSDGDPLFRKERDSLLPALLQGRHQECLRLAEEFLKTPDQLENFYLQVVQPCMYRIGFLWESGKISVAQEHLASAVIIRILAVICPQCKMTSRSKGKALVTCAPNEYHQLGAWMVADLLALDGWDTHYLGADIPCEDVTKYVAATRPHLMCISVAMPFNVDKAMKIIDIIRDDSRLKDVKIMVGGYFFRSFPDLWKLMKADAYAADAKAAVKVARKWWQKSA